LKELGWRDTPDKVSEHVSVETVPKIWSALKNLDSKTMVPLSFTDSGVSRGFKTLVYGMAKDRDVAKSRDLLDRFGLDARDLFDNVMCPLMEDVAYRIKRLSIVPKETLLFLQPTWERVVGPLSLEDRLTLLCRPNPEYDPGLLAAKIKQHVPYLVDHVGAK